MRTLYFENLDKRRCMTIIPYKRKRPTGISRGLTEVLLLQEPFNLYSLTPWQCQVLEPMISNQNI